MFRHPSILPALVIWLSVSPYVIAQEGFVPSFRGPYRTAVIEGNRAVLAGEKGTVEISLDQGELLRHWEKGESLPEGLPAAGESVEDRYAQFWWLSSCKSSSPGRRVPAGDDCTLFRSTTGGKAISVLDGVTGLTLGPEALITAVRSGGEVVFPGQDLPPLPSPGSARGGSFVVAYNSEGTLWLACTNDGMVWEYARRTWIRRQAAPLEIGRPQALAGNPSKEAMYLLGDSGLARWPREGEVEIVHLAPLEQRISRSLLTGVAVALALLALLISMAAFIYRKYRKGPPRRWSITDAIVGVTTFVIIQVGTQLILIAIWGVSATDPVAMMFSFGAGSVTACGWVGLRMRQSGIRAADIGLHLALLRKPGDSKLLKEVGWGVLTAPVVWILVALTAVGCEALAFPETLYRQESITGVLESRGLVNMIALFVMAVVLAPLVEEILFRGFLLSAIRARWGTLPAVVITTTLFGVMHIEGILTVGMLGLVLALVTLLRRSLLPAMVAHAVINGASFVLVASGFGS